MTIDNSSILGYGYVKQICGRLQWDVADRYNFSDPIDGAEPYLSGLSWCLPKHIDSWTAEINTLKRIVAVTTTDIDVFFEALIDQRADNSSDVLFWKNEYFSKIEPVPTYCTLTLLGYDVTTTWLKREPVPSRLVGTLKVDGELGLFPSLDAAMKFQIYIAQFSESPVFTLGVYSLS
jgi:hypothetical protein